jgi:hypothetical protein
MLEIARREMQSFGGRHTQHDEPLRLLDAVLVGLGVAEGGDVDLVGLVNLLLGTVADEDGLASPLDDDLMFSFHQLYLLHARFRWCRPTFLPSGMALRSTSTLAMAKTSAEADMLTRNSAEEKNRPLSVRAK